MMSVVWAITVLPLTSTAHAEPDPTFCRMTLGTDLITSSVQQKARDLLPKNFTPGDLLQVLSIPSKNIFDRSVQTPTIDELRDIWIYLGLPPDQVQAYELPKKYFGSYKPYTDDLNDFLLLIENKTSKNSVDDFLRVVFLERRKSSSYPNLYWLFKNYDRLGVPFPGQDRQAWSHLTDREKIEQAGQFLFSLHQRYHAYFSSGRMSQILASDLANVRDAITTSLITLFHREARVLQKKPDPHLVQIFKTLPAQKQFLILTEISNALRESIEHVESISSIFSHLATSMSPSDPEWNQLAKVCETHLSSSSLANWGPISNFPAGRAVETIAAHFSPTNPTFSASIRESVVTRYLGRFSPEETAKKLSQLPELLGPNYKTAIDHAVKRLYEPIIGQLPVHASRAIIASVPALQTDLAYTLISQFELPASAMPDTVLQQVIQNQGQINALLKDTLMDVIQSGAPPAGFAKHPKPWGAFLKQLPSEVRYEATLSLLKTRVDRVSRAVELISQIEPLPGSREAVLDFANQSQLFSSNRTDFEPRQIQQMFPPEHWEGYFPLSPPLDPNAGIRTQLSIAVRSNGNTPINRAWVREKLEDEGTAQGAMRAFGFKPVRNYGNLETQLSGTGPLDGLISRSDQARGLIVQGYYEKSGDTLMNVNRARGADQVEDTAPEVNRRLESNLSSSWLSQEPLLIQQLFVRGWEMNADSSLIASIRRKAIRVANLTSAFWDLRVQIHNFPTPKIIAETRAFLNRRSLTPEIIRELESLIQQMDQFVGQNTSGPEWSSVVDLFNASASEKESLLALTAGIDQADYAKKMSLSQNAIGEWRRLTQAFDGNRARHIPFWSGQRRILEYRLAHHVSELEKIPLSSPEHVIRSAQEYLPSMLDSLELEYLIDRDLRRRFEAMIQDVFTQTQLSSEKKAALYGSIVQNLLDQIYAKIRREFGRFEDIYHPIVSRESPRFTDGLLRSTTAFALGKYVDQVFAGLTAWKKIVHQINGQDYRGVVEVFNPGQTVGILRLNKSPMTLMKNEIGVFDSMPVEMNACAGMITLGTGARLSHVQLLAKALQVPNVKVDLGLKKTLQELDGQWVNIQATRSGKLTITPAVVQESAKKRRSVKVPRPNLELQQPYRFQNAGDWANLHVAGPKGTYLAQAFSDPRLRPYSEDGFVLPFGFFNLYLKNTQISNWLSILADTQVENKYLVSLLAGKISAAIKTISIPDAMLDDIIREMENLRERTGHTGGYFFRSDTNIEDLPGFNGAGLNESVANIAIDRKRVDAAIRRVWASAFTEKSIYWRAMAVGQETVPIAYPSVVVMPTVSAKSSGVYVSRGELPDSDTTELISANYGIGSVVESGTAVEEITLETGSPVRYAMSAAQQKPQASVAGGLQNQPVTTPKYVLTYDQAKQVVKLGEVVRAVFGPAPYGWDIEWAFDGRGRLKFLQCRHNMAPNADAK